MYNFFSNRAAWICMCAAMIVVAILGVSVFCSDKDIVAPKAMSIAMDLMPSGQRTMPPTDLTNMSFGSVFTDHMFVMEWAPECGWHNARIQPYTSFNCDPAMISMHYGPSIFEGMKAYKTVDGGHALFRPDEHFIRFNRSARRMCMPEINVDFVIEALKKLVDCDKAWVPGQRGTALYIRPCMVASETTINLKVANRFLFFIIMCPVGALYKEGFNPTSIMVSKTFTRASVGGVGDVKTAGNYAASMLAQQEAKAQGFSQVLWLDPVQRRFVEEVGSMNIFFVINGQLITPELNGTILPGITRKSVIQLAQKWGMSVMQRQISIDEVIDAINDGSLTEMFGTGTAAVVSPVGKLHYGDQTYLINDNKTGPTAQRFFDDLSDIYQGKDPYSFAWLNFIV